MKEHLLSGQAGKGWDPLYDDKGQRLVECISGSSDGRTGDFNLSVVGSSPARMMHLLLRQKGTNSKDRIAKMVIAGGSYPSFVGSIPTSHGALFYQ